VASEPATYSVVIPVYGNEATLPAVVRAMEELAAELDGRLEVVFVVDGSPDGSLILLRRLLAGVTAFASQLTALSRNYGAFSAIRVGLAASTGAYVAVMAADLQEPPELILEFFRVLEQGNADVVFAKREGRGDPLVSRLLSAAFWSAYRRFVLPDMPPGGIDVFACCRNVRNAVLEIEEPNSSLIA